MTKEIYYAKFGLSRALSSLKSLLRTYLPEHTTDDETDLLNVFAYLDAHVMNREAGMLDLVASSNFITSARTRTAMQAILKLIGRELSPPSPAIAEILMKTTGSFADGTTIVQQYAKFVTKGTTQITFEYIDSDLVSNANTLDWGAGDGQFFTSQNSVFAAMDSTPFQTIGGTLAKEDGIYVGHEHLIFTGLLATMTVVNTNNLLSWEYYDNVKTGTPDSVTDLTGSYRFVLNDYIGTTRRDDLKVRVTYIETGAYEDCYVVWDVGSGQNRIVTTDYLGESVADTTAGHYLLSAEWLPLPNLTDGSVSGGYSLGQTGQLSWDLPFDDEMHWTKTTVNSVEAYWVRCRQLSLGASVPEFTNLTSGTGDFYLVIEVNQGNTVVDNLGTTTSLADQEYVLSNDGYIMDSVQAIEIGTDTAWTQVDNFIESLPTDKHYRIEEKTDGYFYLIFGDGSNGAIPPAGQSVVLTYRIDADDNGNVGADSISTMLSGTYYLGAPTNPLSAAGWKDAEGATEEGLEKLRITGPASIRTIERAVTADDVKYLAENTFVTTAGARPIARAIPIENPSEGSVNLICVGAGGGYLPADTLTEIEEWFNGEVIGMQRIGGRMILGQQLVASNYVQNVIAVTADLTIKRAYYASADSLIRAALLSILSPLALDIDGVSYYWDLTDTVTLIDDIRSTIWTAVPGIKSGTISVSLPAGDTPLSGSELPYAGTITLNITPE